MSSADRPRRSCNSVATWRTAVVAIWVAAGVACSVYADPNAGAGGVAGVAGAAMLAGTPGVMPAVGANAGAPSGGSLPAAGSSNLGGMLNTDGGVAGFATGGTLGMGAAAGASSAGEASGGSGEMGGASTGGESELGGAAGAAGAAGAGGATMTSMAGADGVGPSTPAHRYIKLVATSELGGHVWSSVAELQVMTSGGVAIDRRGWKIAADSEALVAEVAPATNAIDGDASTYWHSSWSLPPNSANDAPLPHWLSVDLGAPLPITGFSYQPRQANSNGRIKGWEFYVSDDGTNWGLPVQTGMFPDGPALQTITFASVP